METRTQTLRPTAERHSQDNFYLPLVQVTSGCAAPAATYNAPLGSLFSRIAAENALLQKILMTVSGPSLPPRRVAESPNQSVLIIEVRENYRKIKRSPAAPNTATSESAMKPKGRELAVPNLTAASITDVAVSYCLWCRAPQSQNPKFSLCLRQFQAFCLRILQTGNKWGNILNGRSVNT